MFPTDGSGRPKVLVRDVTDISRLIFRLCTRWTLPRVEVQIDSLAPVVAQHAQHHFARISESCNCVLGVALAAMTLLGRSYMSWASLQSWLWTSRQFWQHLGLIAITALLAGLIGWLIEAAWTRIRLMLVLRRLWHRLVAGETFSEPARYVGRVSRQPAAKDPAASEGGAVAHDNLTQRPLISGQRRPKILFRGTTDMYRLVIHLFTHWTLPRVEIGVDGVPTLDVQRAQQRIARLSGTCNCALGAWLAATTLLVGAFWVQWTSSKNWDWMVPESWRPLGLVVVAALCAALIGTAIEMVWTRARLILVLHGVRHRLGT